MSQRPLDPADILGAGDSSFAYYDLLPSDNPVLAADWPRLDLSELGRRLEGLSYALLVEEDIDALSLALLALGTDSLPPGINWHGIATQLSLLYAHHLKPGGARLPRMKAARANFFLRDRIDAASSVVADVIDERRFANPFVWDWLSLPEGELVADSSELNVSYRKRDGTTTSARMGLPTQIDALPGGHYALSSCYSDGWFDWSASGGQQLRAHSRPVVLVFSADHVVYSLDRDGVIHAVESGREIARIPVETVWRARSVGDNLYVSDWAEPRILTVVNTQNWIANKIDTGPVLLTNDIVQLGERVYVLDKMQGSVFSFDLNFKFIDTRLSFGKKRGQLCDPITLRVHDGNVAVLSWLTGALTTIKPF